MVAAVMGPPLKGQQPGFPGSPPGGGGLGPTLADQLKNRLEERRRSQEETVSPSDPLHAEMRQAVKAANDAGNRGVLVASHLQSGPSGCTLFFVAVKH